MTDTKEAHADMKGVLDAEKSEGVASGEIRDIGAELYAEIDQLSPEELEREGREVRKLLDWRILPIVCAIFAP